MTKGFKIKRQAINKTFFETMKDTFKEFCISTRNVLFGFSFSDEISIIISRNEKDNDDNRIEKLLSILSGKLALVFYRNAQKHKLNLNNEDWVFDARIIQLNKLEVVEYFLARQAYAIDKLKTEHNIDFRLKTSKAVLTELNKIGIMYDKLPKEYRYCLIYSPIKNISSFEFDTDQSLLQQTFFSE